MKSPRLAAPFLCSTLSGDFDAITKIFTRPIDYDAWKCDNVHHQNDAERRFLKKMTTALTFRAESDFIDAIRSYSEKAGLSVNAALKEIIAPVIGFARRRSNMPRNDLASFCGALKDVDCSELEATQAAFSEIDEEMWK